MKTRETVKDFKFRAVTLRQECEVRSSSGQLRVPCERTGSLRFRHEVEVSPRVVGIMRPAG